MTGSFSIPAILEHYAELAHPPSVRWRVTLLLSVAITSVAMTLALVQNPAPNPTVLFLALLPVAVATYGRNGYWLGLGVAVFFGTALLPVLLRSGDRATVVQWVVLMIVYLIFALAAGTIAASLRARRSLTATVQEWQRLLGQADDLDQLVTSIMRTATDLTGADRAALLLRNPLDDLWDLREMDRPWQRALPAFGQDEPMSLAHWLVQQERPLLIEDLSADPRFATAEPTPWVLLAVPLRQRDDSLLAVLVLLDGQGAALGWDELRILTPLVSGGEQLLEQAGLYVRTDHVLAERVRQLGAIQRTARELNATLDLDKIVQEILSCAMDLTGADAGMVDLSLEAFPPVYRTRGTDPDAETVAGIGRAARRLRRPAAGTALPSTMPTLLPVPKARLVVPIRRSQQSLGAVVVEREQDPAWGRETLQPLVSLADHAAVAVENVRLFAQIQREKDRANQIISSMTDGLLTLDQNARVISINPAAEALTGWRTEEAVGHLLCEVLGCLTGEPRDEACSLVRAVRERSSIHSEKRNIRHRLGFDCVLSISVAHLPALGEHAGGSVVLLHDITEEEALERFQRELIASFSHELRTPLTSITTIAEMLAIDEDVKGDSSRREQLEMLQQQSQRLASFAQRILELSLLESGQWILELRPLPLAHLVSGVVRQWQSSWPGRRFSLQVPDGHLWAWADEQALQTVVNCLVDNAVKYAPADTPVELSVEIGPAGYAEIGVQDHGPGISPQHQERIFQRFYRVDGGDAQRVYGYGLGLHIAKHLATAMGGQISVSSTPETGSRFTVLLPITGERA